MSKKKIAIIIFALVMLFGSVLFAIKNTYNKEVKNENKSEIEIVIENCRIAWEAQAEAGLNLSFDEDMCILEFAEEKNDPLICEKYMKKQHSKDGCFNEFGEKLNDEKLCEKIEDSEWRASCYSAVGSHKGDLLICDKAGADRHYLCYWEVAVVKNEPTICRSINTKEDCYRNYFEKIICSKFIDKEYEGLDVYRCLEKIENIKNEELISFCEKIDDEISKYECFLNISIMKNDKKICDYIEDNCYKTRCNSGYYNISCSL